MPEDKTATGADRSLAIARVRGVLARVLWLAFLVCALCLACAAFSFALEANERNDLVKLVRSLADAFDLHYFDLENPVWAPDPDKPNALVKTALANYGVAAVIYLVVGRFAERIVRP
jgi:hypothetical protein